MFGGKRNGIAKSKRVALNDALGARFTLRIIRNEDDGLAGASNKIGKIFIIRRHARARVYDEKNSVSGDNCVFCLGAHPPFKRCLRPLL